MKASLIQQLKWRLIFWYVLIGAVVGLVAGVIYSYFEPQEFPGILVRAALVGALIAFCISSFEEFFYPKYLRKQTFLVTFFVKLFFYSIIISANLIFINIWGLSSVFEDSYLEAAKHYIYNSTFIIDFFYGFIVSVTFVTFLQVRRLQSRGVLINYLLGRYHHPTEVERIFLFVDLKSSTTLGDQMGNMKFSAFLREYFFDITEPLLLTKGDVYMYEGDGVIISWPMRLGLKRANCVQCFFYMQDSFKKLQSKYEKKFGTSPVFKAGLHGGKVIVTWVGEVKREIVYHGDVLNTTSRIQGECNRLEEDFLISESLLKKLTLPPHIQSNFQEELLLRGKLNKVKIHSLNRYFSTPYSRSK